jgi:predicted phosphodiesterase
MRLAILADIHGNLAALEAVMADVKRQSVDGLIVAGDFVDRPQPLETVRAVQALGACAIRGNREDYVLAYAGQDAPAHWRTSRQWIGVRWLCERLDREALDYIASLPAECAYSAGGADPIRVVHAAPRSTTELVLPGRDPVAMALYRQAGLLGLRRSPISIDRALTRFDEATLICAHSHIPWKQEPDGKLVINPGSVGIPINGDTRAQYALLTWESNRWQTEHRAVSYDIDRIRAAYRESGILAVEGAFAHAQLRGIETAQNVPGRLVLHCRRHATQAGVPESEAIPDAIWDEAVATFDWETAAGGPSEPEQPAVEEEEESYEGSNPIGYPR